MSMFIGEALVGDGNEIAHIDLLIGDKDGPVGMAFANALADQKAGPLQPAGRADAEPGLQAGHGADHQGDDQGRQAGGADVRPGPGRRRQGRRRLRGRGRHPQEPRPRTWCIVCGVFIHWEAKDDTKIYQYNYEATKLSIQPGHEGRAEDRRNPRQEGHGQAPVLARSERQAENPGSARHRSVAERVRPRRGRGRRGGSRFRLRRRHAGERRRSRAWLHLHAQGTEPHGDIHRRIGPRGRQGGFGRGPRRMLPQYGLQVSAMLDSNGANTTAAAAVRAAGRHLNLANTPALVLGGTGPVGQRVARLLARAGAEVRIGSRQKDRAEIVCVGIRHHVPGAHVESVATATSADAPAALWAGFWWSRLGRPVSC